MKAAGPELKSLWRAFVREKSVQKVRKTHTNPDLKSFLHKLCSHLSLCTSSHNFYILKRRKKKKAATNRKQEVPMWLATTGQDKAASPSSYQFYIAVLLSHTRVAVSLVFRSRNDMQ